MVTPIFGVDVSGIVYQQERVEGTYPTGAFRFVAPELRATWQAQYAPYPVNALGSRDVADFVTGGRMDASQFTFDLTASGIAYLKDGINLGGASTSGAYWSHTYIGRAYSQTDGETVYWTASGARIGSVAIGPGAASWQTVVTIVHKPPTISGADPTSATITDWPGAAADPVLNPHTVGSGTLFQFNGAAWYLADVGFQVNNNLVPVGVCGEQNASKWNVTNRDIAVAAVPYEPNLQTYIPLMNTAGTGVLTLATGRTVTFGGLVFYGMRQLPFDPVRPATVSLVGAARTVSLAG